MTFFPIQENDELLSHFEGIGSPSDNFKFTNETALELMEFYVSNMKVYDKGRVPSDVVFNKTIPMLDCIIDIVAEDENFSRRGRVCIKSDYMNSVNEALRCPDHIILIGIIFIEYSSKREVAKPIFIKHGYDHLLISVNYLDTRSDHGLLKAVENIGSRGLKAFERYVEISQMLDDIDRFFLLIWYSIQIALLHPTVKTIVGHSYKIKERLNKSERKQVKGGRITKYVKYHVLTNLEELKNSMNETVETESGTRVRHCMAWYVIGHWRTYSNGNKVFVRPYWKGPMRELKRNLDDGRTRKIDAPEEKGEVI